jgi:DNA polymerase-3 subunit delta
MMGVRVRLLCGEDDFAIAQNLAKIEEQYGNQSERLLSVTRLDGRNLSLDDLKGALYSLPLFASSRLVEVSHLAGHLQKQPVRNQFLEAIAGIPESTQLVLVESQRLPSDHWLFKWFKDEGLLDSVTVFGLKKGYAMDKWIQEEVKSAGGKISPQAAGLLSSLVIDDSRMAYQEIQKLLTYVNFARRIEVEDIEAICVSMAQGNVFAMVDALGNRDGRNASSLLYQLLQERDALSLFQMMVRQFRMILVARELMDGGGRVNELAEYFRIQEFVSKKVWSQASQFSIVRVERVFHILLDLDKKIKLGELDQDIALEIFVAEFTSSSEK